VPAVAALAMTSVRRAGQSAAAYIHAMINAWWLLPSFELPAGILSGRAVDTSLPNPPDIVAEAAAPLAPGPYLVAARSVAVLTAHRKEVQRNAAGTVSP
jgi:hypothetical protein